MDASFVKQKGFSLIEILVALAITLVLVIIVSYSYLGTKNVNRTTDEQTQIYEEGRFALEALGQNIRLAGFTTGTDIFYKIRFKDILPESAGFHALLGCEGGVDTTSFACVSLPAVADPDAFSVTYFTDDPANGNNRNLGIGVDCVGADAIQQIGHTPNGNITLYYVTNLYFLNSIAYTENGVAKTLYQLSCRGSGNAIPQPLFKGVRDMQLLYGVASANSNEAVDRLYTAGEIQGLNLWNQVISARICLVMESINGGATAGVTTYTDCNGANQNAPSGYIRRAFTATYNLRNRVSQ
jgi:type IV pilus assembly protein PilW